MTANNALTCAHSWKWELSEGAVLMKRILLLAAAWACCALGVAGIAIPVLPTTPLLLAATFLFARSSPRLHAWIVSSRLYCLYVAPFKAAGGMPLAAKAKALLVTYAVMGISAYLVQKPVVWAILACCAVLMAYIILVRVPSVKSERVAALRSARTKAE